MRTESYERSSDMSNVSRIGETSGGYMGVKNVHSSFLVILGALLCALISVIVVNLVVKCVMCYRRRRHGDIESNGSNTNKALKKAALKAIPIVVIGIDLDLEKKGVFQSHNQQEQHSECPICLCEFAKGDQLRIMPNCSHLFHSMCIDTWLSAHSSCPTCRGSLS